MEKLFRQPCGQGAAPRLCRQGTENAQLQHCLCQRAKPGTILHLLRHAIRRAPGPASLCVLCQFMIDRRSEEHTSELQSLMRTSYAVFCLKKNKQYIETKS